MSTRWALRRRPIAPSPNPIFDAFEVTEKKIRALFSPSIQLESSLIVPYAEDLAKEEESELIFICGHHEGYKDERIKTLVTDEISLRLCLDQESWRLRPWLMLRYAWSQKWLARSSATKMIVFLQAFSNTLSTHGPMIIVVWLCRISLMSGHYERFVSGDCMRVSKETYERRPDLLNTINWQQKKKKILAEIKETKNKGETLCK